MYKYIYAACWTDWYQHDGVIKWKHFPRYWPFVRGIHRSPVGSPRKGQRRGALMFSLISAWTNRWANNRDAGDLRRHRDHYDVTVMNANIILYGYLTFTGGWIPLKKSPYCVRGSHIIISSNIRLYISTYAVKINLIGVSFSFSKWNVLWNHQQCCWFLYVETCNFGETNPHYRAPEIACQVRHVLMT